MTPPTQVILRWRWIILIVAPLVTLFFEIAEGHELSDLSFMREILFYGLLTPATVWFLLTRLARDMEQRAKQAVELEGRRQLTHRIAQCQEWSELTRFIVEFPNTVLAAEYAALFIHDVRNSELKRVAEWNPARGHRLVKAQGQELEKLCFTCHLPRLRHIARCEHQTCPVDRREWEDVCIPLAYSGILVGLLRFGCRDAAALTDEQRAVLDEAASEMALALVRLIAYPGQLAQVRTAAQSYERRQIAQTLHNSLAQQIGYLHLSLDRLSGHEGLAKHDDLLSELEHMRDVAGEAYKHIRDTLAFLRSQEQADLTQAIRDYAPALAHKTQLQIEFSPQGEPLPLSPLMGSRLFSLVQEGLNNVEKHARAQHVQITLTWLTNGLHLVVSDDGAGFVTEATASNGHYGLAMMQESVEELGGTFVVESAPGRGTRLQFAVPLASLQINPDLEDALRTSTSARAPIDSAPIFSN